MTVIDGRAFFSRRPRHGSGTSGASTPPPPPELPKNHILIVPNEDGTHRVSRSGTYRQNRMLAINALTETAAFLSRDES
ncbi:hypothetical protein AWB76_03260 [Caballeronia temeraria]|uniref:Uncharacterized protein n=1 Tax=Caballeronia temeraria TaxID=1777137 RepID=A0A158AXT3_9BURK|nr:hypothetical protein [Caballeronia temeraria]SAK62519.1 hypothetical protein AWB76_03260 [Caballeronia temeraria]